MRLESVRFGCVLQKSDVSARAPHGRPTRRCTFHLPGRTLSLGHPGRARTTRLPGERLQRTPPPGPGTSHLPVRTPDRASRPWPPRKPPWPARTTHLPGRAAAVATEASRSLPASRTQRPHPQEPTRAAQGHGIRQPRVLSPHPDYPANQAQRRFGTPFNTRELARKSMGDVKSTGLGRDRLRSVDRNNKTTLLLTRRCGTNKSYAKDLSPRMVKLQDVS